MSIRRILATLLVSAFSIATIVSAAPSAAAGSDGPPYVCSASLGGHPIEFLTWGQCFEGIISGANWPDGTNQVLVVGTNHEVYETLRSTPDSEWTEWVSLGGNAHWYVGAEVFETYVLVNVPDEAGDQWCKRRYYDGRQSTWTRC